jgi:hypothetical protein
MSLDNCSPAASEHSQHNGADAGILLAEPNGDLIVEQPMGKRLQECSSGWYWFFGLIARSAKHNNRG